MAQFILVDGIPQDFVSSQPNGRFTLKELQDRVGGYIELVSLPDASKVMIVNEDGRLLHLGANPVASLIAEIPIVGTAVIMDHAEWIDEEDDGDCGHDTDCWDDEDDDDNYDGAEWDED